MKQIISLLISVYMLHANVFGQIDASVFKSPFILGTVDSLYSKELKETRYLNIYLPAGYNPDSASNYPVLYLLDGSANEDFIHVCGIVQFMNMIEYMPPTIVIGIANVDRRRDFTFPTKNVQDKTDYPTTGSSAAFIQFIKNELEPFVEKKYSANSNKTIIGQSLGGLLASEILLNEPGLFSNYIIVSPSLWWDDESMLRAANDLLSKHKNMQGHVIIAVGTEGDVMEADAKNLAEILNTSGIKLLKTEFIPMPEEDHLTILHNAVYQSILHLYPPSK